MIGSHGQGFPCSEFAGGYLSRTRMHTVVRQTSYGRMIWERFERSCQQKYEQRSCEKTMHDEGLQYLSFGDISVGQVAIRSPLFPLDARKLALGCTNTARVEIAWLHAYCLRHMGLPSTSIVLEMAHFYCLTMNVMTG